jgi:glycosyltransferase involved in cell wall biosynthesis
MTSPSPTAQRLSCIMPVWNGERYLAAALDSVLGQTRPPDEMIVVDDGSTDGTRAILDGYRDRYGDTVRVVHLEHHGVSRALNSGIEVCTGDLVTFCDADDLLTPEAIAVRLTVFEERHDLDAVFGCVEQFVSPDVPDAVGQRLRFTPGAIAAPVLGALIARRSVFERFGPFDETKAAGTAIAWMAIARSAGMRIATVDDTVLRRRLHQTNMSLTTGRAGNRDLLAVVREHRRRTGGAPT